MTKHTLPPSPLTLQALGELQAGVIAASTYRSGPHAACSALYLQTVAGHWVRLGVRAAQLQLDFAVFALHAETVAALDVTGQHPLVVPGPVSIVHLYEEQWFDAALPTSPAHGLEPPAPVREDAYRAGAPRSAYCRYLRGIELGGRDGHPLLVCAGAAPYGLHVTGICEAPGFAPKALGLMRVEPPATREPAYSP